MVLALARAVGAQGELVRLLFWPAAEIRDGRNVDSQAHCAQRDAGLLAAAMGRTTAQGPGRQPGTSALLRR